MNNQNLEGMSREVIQFRNEWTNETKVEDFFNDTNKRRLYRKIFTGEDKTLSKDELLRKRNFN